MSKPRKQKLSHPFRRKVFASGVLEPVIGFSDVDKRPPKRRGL